MAVRQRGSAAFLALFCVLLVGSCSQETFRLLPGAQETGGGTVSTSGGNGSDSGGSHPGGGEAPVGEVGGSAGQVESGGAGQAGASQGGAGHGGQDGLGGTGGHAEPMGGGGGALGNPPDPLECERRLDAACSAPGGCKRCGQPDDDECPSDARMCDECRFCKQCELDEHCDGSQVCDTLTKRCTQPCERDEECRARGRGTPYCEDERCVACWDNRHCEMNGIPDDNVCFQYRCVECEDDNDCDDDLRCEDLQCVER